MSSATAAPGQPGPRLNAAFYADSVAAFLRASDDEVYAPLASPHGYTLAPEQLSAWRLQLPVLRAALADEKGDSHLFRGEKGGCHLFHPVPWIHLEFDIPRLGRRVDAVLVTSTAVIPIEFKVGAKKFEQLDYEQAWDYGLDLKNFHAPSHAAAIFPILCATEAPKSDRRWKPPHADGVRPPLCCNAAGLGPAIALALNEETVPAPISAPEMVAGTFSGSVSSGPPRIGLCRSAVKAFIQNVHHFRDATLRDRSAPVDHVVVFDEAQRAWDARQLASFMKRKKGLPGFTQTEPELLIGAMERHADWAVVVCLVGGGQEINTGEAGISAWLDGVRTLFASWDVFISPHLTDSEYAASGALDRLSKSRAKTVPAPTFDEETLPAPTFDEETVPAPTFDEETAPEMVAGTFSGLAPETVADTFSGAGATPGTLTTHPALHLSPSMRSFRAEHVSRFVKALLDGEAELGRELFAEFRDHYPIVLTRSMRAARRWIRRQRRGTERADLVASSSARAAQAPRDRHPGEHRPGALVFEPAARHPLIAVSGGRGDGVSGAGAGARLDDRHVGRRPPLAWERLELSPSSRGQKDAISRTDVKKPERR